MSKKLLHNFLILGIILYRVLELAYRSFRWNMFPQKCNECKSLMHFSSDKFEKEISYRTQTSESIRISDFLVCHKCGNYTNLDEEESDD